MFTRTKFPYVLITLLVISSLFIGACTSVNDAKALCAPYPVENLTWYGTVTCGTATEEASSIPTPIVTRIELTNQQIEDLVYFAGGVQGWEGGPKNVNYAGIFNQDALRDGVSLQAYWPEWSFMTTFMDFPVPTNFEPANDGGFQILVVNQKVYIPNRGKGTGLQFWKMSYAKLLANGNLRLCEHDTTPAGDWIGEGYGECTEVEGFPLSEVANHLPADLSEHWYQLNWLMNNIKDYASEVPSYGHFHAFWIND